jgi:hypothetical protein
MIKNCKIHIHIKPNPDNPKIAYVDIYKDLGNRYFLSMNWQRTMTVDDAEAMQQDLMDNCGFETADSQDLNDKRIVAPISFDHYEFSKVRDFYEWIKNDH